MDVKQHVFYEGDKIYISEEFRNLANEEYGMLYYYLEKLITSKNCCEGVVPITELNQFIETVIASIDILGVDTRFPAIPEVIFLVVDVIEVLNSENYVKGLIPKDFASKFMRKIISIYQEKSFKNYSDFSYAYYRRIKLLRDYLMKDGISISNDDYDKIIKSLDSEKDILMAIVKSNLNKIEDFDEETIKKTTSLIEQIVGKAEGEKSSIDFSTIVSLLLSENFIKGKIKDDQLEMFNELIDTEFSKSSANKFLRILNSENYGKGIIGNEYLRQILSLSKSFSLSKPIDIDCLIQIRVLSELLTSEYYELCFITKEYLDLIASKDYRVITGMIDYFVDKNDELSLEDKYNWILGIFQIENKQELCQELEKLAPKNRASICEIGTLYAQYNLMGPKFNIGPTDKRGK